MGRRRLHQKNTEERAMDLIEDLREFEQFKQEVLPMLRDAVAKKKPSEEIFELVRAHSAAKLATIALLEKDSQKAMQAIDKILQRTDGPVVQKSETEHRFGRLKDEQLVALLKTKLNKTQSDEDDSEQS